jgi:serine/threonine protein kinase
MSPHTLVGTGTLFEVRHFREQGRDLVVKRLLPRFRREPEARAALAREAHVLSAVRHRAVPEIVRVGTDDHGPFLVETFVAGTSIRRIVDSWSDRGGVPGRLAAHVTRRAFEVLAQLCAASGPSGPLGFVHGDIGPEHVVVTPEVDVRLVDFGASRISDLPVSLLGDPRGTLPFTAPEIARGEAPLSAAGDVYSMAATALFLASGEPLCAATEAAAMLLEVGTRGVRTELLLRAAAFRPAEKEALAAALAVDAGRRLTSAAEIVAAFDEATSLDHSGPSAAIPLR